MTTQRLTIERPSPFRRRRFVVPHRRRSKTLLLLRPFLTALVLVGGPVAAGIWVFSSPRFLLSEIEIGGTVHVGSSEVETALQPLAGRHLLTLSLSDVEDLLVADPWIQGAAIRKQLPNRLVVEVRERSPAALLRRSDGIFYIDATGFVIERYDPRGPVNLPLLSVASGSRLEVAPAMALVDEIERLAPAWAAGISEVESLGGGDYRVYAAEPPFPILVTATDLEAQLAKLDALLPEILRRYDSVATVDLRFSRQIVIQPAESPRSQEG